MIDDCTEAEYLDTSGCDVYTGEEEDDWYEEVYDFDW